MSAVLLKKILNTAALLTLLAGAGSASAHAHLQQSTPAADSTVATANEVRLTFSEGVEEKFTKVTLSHDGAPVAVSSIKTEPGNKKVLIVTPAQALPAGKYSVDWKAVSVDTHNSAGQYGFTVGN
ncbi:MULTISPECIES: copper homeostasis periplasmic binding protein CopC [Pseudomonas]|jgi:hypothetical protein|uniref:copper homeostasis periplasmic binding protein CopC n=1 Tax=Pseudomonas TaxID=286 RepID=UPI000288C1A1|nr:MULTISPECIES: copper homeostasis periplasmic binding protein CopC [Pseudomonas]AMB80237.1 hypothetical protein AV641_14750 [Pseudomonas fragi]MCB1655758.1 copper homeostasis periplasmic binding protein CopC [Pseudomonadales bacterium]NBF15518.1 copper homeostasis periplasmic binding protein CopC [Pseudomonas sp. Fl4BN2]NNG62402.1 copper homeostasis periplasmic binding protein CopC [Pseudomonas sp. GC01]AUB75954.1 hypothetical protein B195_014285 [Pseudomonas sp. Lz4W]